MDTALNCYHMDIMHSLVDEGEINKEQAVMNEHESRVIHISVQTQGISSSVEPTIKTENK